MVNWGMLAAAPRGYMNAQSQDLQNQQRLIALQDAQMNQGADALIGNALGSLGSMPQTGWGMQQPIGMAPTQSPAPGQSSQPMGEPPDASSRAFAGYNTVGLPPMPEFIQQRAQQYGADPQTAVKVASAESSIGANRVGDGGTSFGPFQLHVGGGLGDTFRQQTRLDPSDPANDYATADWALRNAPQTGWGPYHGAARVGIGPREGLPGGPPPGSGMPPGGQPGGSMGAGAGFRQPIDLETAITALRRANPNAPPEMIFRALNRMVPLLQADARAQLMEMNQAYRLSQMELAQARLDQGQQRLDQGSRKLDQGDQKIDQGGRKLDQGDRKLDQGDRRQTEVERHNRETEILAQERIDAAEENRKLKMEVGAKPSLTEEAINQRAALANAGKDKEAYSNLGSGNVGAANRAAIANRQAALWAEEGLSPQDIIKRQAQINGQSSAIRTAGTIVGRVTQAANALDATLPVARQALKELDATGIRTQYPKLNEFLQKSDEELGNPKIVAFRNALTTVINTYARVISGGYRPTDESRARATSVLQDRWNSGQIEAAFKQIEVETDAELNANQKTLDDISAGKFGAKPRNTNDPGGGQTLKKIDDTVRAKMQGARNRGWTPQQILDDLKAKGYDTSGLENAIR